MKKIYFLVLLGIFSINQILAQNNTVDTTCTCCSESHRAFDFWVGDWTVYNSKGVVVGTNKVVKMQDGCVIQENWVAANQRNTGTSYNYYNPVDSTWNQLWVSNSGNVLELKGNLNEKGEMVLRSKLVRGKKGPYFNRITWTLNADAPSPRDGIF